MENKTRSCLWGCGIGCVFLVILAVIAMVLVGSQLSKLSEGFEESIETHAELDRTYPAPREYTPPADGAIPADRMQRFLEIRTQVAPARDRLRATMASFELNEQKLDELEESDGAEKFRGIVDLVWDAFSMPGGISEFQRTRNRILLDHGMGFGEYTYIFLNLHQAGGRVRVETPEGGSGDIVGPAFQANRRVRREWRGMLERQAKQRMEDSPAPETDTWLARLRAELERLESDSRAWPWADGLPPETESSVAPYRERLQELYDPAAHDLELMHSRKTGPGSFTID